MSFRTKRRLIEGYWKSFSHTVLIGYQLLPCMYNQNSSTSKSGKVIDKLASLHISMEGKDSLGKR